VDISSPTAVIARASFFSIGFLLWKIHGKQVTKLS
jgi:hypothetical protein